MEAIVVGAAVEWSLGALASTVVTLIKRFIQVDDDRLYVVRHIHTSVQPHLPFLQ